MRTVFCLSALVGLTISGRAAAVDLARIDRSLRKEPTYVSKPEYCLLVFGAEANVRVWVVLDGDVLYLDRNGDGDLTGPGERVAALKLDRDVNKPPEVEVMRTFELHGWRAEAEPVLTCGPQVQWFYVLQLIPREDQLDGGNYRQWRETPIDLAVTTPTGRAQRSRLRFGGSPREAPVVHFDGPVQLAIDEKFTTLSLRPGEPCELYVRLVTPAVPVTVEVPIQGARWLGWLLARGVWGLGAVPAAGLVWFAVRRRSRTGRSEPASKEES